MLAPLGALDPLGPRGTVWEGACAHTSAKDQPYYGAANRAEESRRTGEADLAGPIDPANCIDCVALSSQNGSAV